MNNKEDIRWAIFMFLTLSQQAEGWAWMLKGVVTQRTKQLLNQYTAAAKSLYTEMLKGNHMDDLIEDGAVWSDLMELFRHMPRHKQEAIYLGFKELLAGNITVQDDDTGVVYIPAGETNESNG